MSRNVLLARITPAVSKRFATFDPANLGPDLSLSNSNQTVTFLTNGDSKNRTARCLYPLSSFTNYVEFLVYAAAGASPTLSGNCALGIVDASASLSTFVGGDAHGYGFLPAEGQIWTNNASSVTTSATCALGDIIGMQAIFTGSSPSLTFFKNGVQIGTINLPASGTWYIAASVGGATGSAMLVFMNAGQQTFQYNAQQSGWWIASPQLSAVNLASEDFMSLPTDTIPNDAYDGAINPTAGQSLHINRSVSFWPWRTTTAAVSGAQSYGNITLDDPSANYDALILNDVRDSQITVKRTQVGGSVNSAANLCLGIIDSVIGDGDFNKIISLKDNLAVLDGIFQHALFLPNADTSIAGKPRPALLGAGRSLPGVLFNSATNAYAISDASMYQLASVRVAGKSLTLSTDYSVSADGTSLILVNPPAGVLTCDASSGSNAVPASATDILSGNGNFASFTTLSQVTANWTLTRGGGSLLAAIPSFSTAAGHGQIVYPQTGGFGYTGVLQSNTNIIAANSIYAVDVIFDANLPNDEGSQQYSILVLDNYAWSSPTSSAGWGYFQTNAANPNPVPIGTAARLIIFNNTSSAVPLCLNFVNGPNSGAGSLNISNIKIYQLPNPTTAAPLNGLTLTQYMNLVMQHGGIAGTAWSQADTQAIDTATGYSSLGNYITQAITMRNALQPALDTLCADIFVDRSGVIRTARLIDPASVTPLGTIGEDVILGTASLGNLPASNVQGSSKPSMISVFPDLAPGLTTCMGARRNWHQFSDGDFQSTSLTDAPASLRALLKQQYQIIAASGKQLSPSYLYAQQAQPLASLFDSGTEAQTEIDRVCALYTTLRYFYVVPVKSDAADNYDIGQVWTLQYPRYNLSTGKPVQIIAVSESPLDEHVSLICWG